MIIKTPHYVPKFIIVLQVVDILINISRMHMIVVDAKQEVLFETWPSAVDDDTGAHVASHLPDLLHFLFVFTV